MCKDKTKFTIHNAKNIRKGTFISDTACYYKINAKRTVLTSTSTLCYSHSSGTAATALASTHDLYLQEV